MGPLLCALMTTANATPTLSVATDAAPWFLGGYSALVMLEPQQTPHLRLSAEAWGMNFPETIIDRHEDNSGEGWQRRIDGAVAITADYHLRQDGRGWHAGITLNTMHSQVSRREHAGQADFWTFEVLPRIGYRWFPSQKLGLFINPWLGIGQLNMITQPAPVGGEVFVEPLFQPLGTIHVGWKL